MSMDAVKTKQVDASTTRTQRRLLTAHQLKRGALLYWAALLMMSAAIIHVVAVLNALPSSALLAVLLIGFTIVQTTVAMTVVAMPARRPLFVAGVLEVVGTLVWVIAHTFGLPDEIGRASWRERV